MQSPHEPLLDELLAALADAHDDEHLPTGTPRGPRPAFPRTLGKSPISPKPGLLSEPYTDASPSHAETIGRYTIDHEINHGVVGNVYSAVDPKLGRRLIIKTVHYPAHRSAAQRSRQKEVILRHVRNLAMLQHPQIAVVYDVEEADDFCFILMEYVPGTNLRRLLEREHHLECERAVHVILQVCRILEFVHAQDIVHGSLQPGHVMLLPESDKIKLTEIGNVHLTDVERLGTNDRQVQVREENHALAYMAPERAHGTMDARIDVFSLGVILYEAVTGRHPFGDEVAAFLPTGETFVPPSLVNLELPAEIDELIGRALETDPDLRYQTMGKFRAALSHFQASILRRKHS